MTVGNGFPPIFSYGINGRSRNAAANATLNITSLDPDTMAGGVETTLPVVNGGEGTGPTAHYGGGFFSKVFKKGKNAVLNCINLCGLNTGENRRGAPPIEEISGAGDEKPPENPIIAMTENQELGKAVIMLAVPMTTGLMFLQPDTLSPAAARFTLVANAVGVTAIWNGILLRKMWPRVASLVEQAGMGSVFLGLHVLVANYLSPELRFFPVICWGFSVLPFVAAAIPAGGCADQDDVCPV
nr:hypothetical protein CDL15_Pgr009501 [Ipomoea batatas]